MSTGVYTGGYDALKSGSKKSATVLAGGNHVIAFAKSATHIVIYQSTSPSRASYTQVLDLTTTTLMDNPRIGLELGHDSTYLDLVYRCNDDTIRHRRITISGWTATAQVTALTLTSAYTAHSLDISMSEGGALLMCVDYANTAPDRAGYIIMMRNTGGTWTQLQKVTIDTVSSFKPNCYESSIAWLRGAGGGATNRRFTMMYSSVSAAGVDRMIAQVHCSVNETTGASFSFKQLTALPTNTLATTGVYNQQPRRQFMFSAGSGIVRTGIVQVIATKMEMYVSTLSITTLGANAAADTVARTDLKVGEIEISSAYLGAMAATFANDADAIPTMSFLAPATGFSDGKVHMYSSVWKFFTASNGQLFPGQTYDYPEVAPQTIMGGSGWALDSRHDVTYFFSSGSKYTSAGVGRSLSLPSGLSPAAAQAVNTSEPVFGALMNNFNWSLVAPLMKMVIQVATDAAFTTSLQTFVSPVGLPMSVYSPSGVSNTFYQTTWNGLDLAPGSWYSRISIRDIYGNTTPYLALAAPFTISHPGYAVNLQPPLGGEGDNVIPYLDPLALGYSNISVGWDYADSFPADFQTAFQIDVYYLGSLFYSSGKVTSSNKFAIIPLVAAAKNHYCIYTVTTWDKYDVSMSPILSGAQGSFVAYNPPTVDSIVLVGGPGGNVSDTAVPTFAYTTTNVGVYPTVQLSVQIVKQGVVVYNGSVTNPVEDSNYTVTQQCLVNDSAYTVTFTVKDSKGMTNSKSYNFTTHWTPPATILSVTVSGSGYNVENDGSVVVMWPDTQRDTDFIQWNIYRRIDEVDSLGNSVTTGIPELIGSNYTTQSSYTFNDYSAPSGAKSVYWVTQVVNRFGSQVESLPSAVVSLIAASDGYWFVDPTPIDPTKASFKIYSVTEDGYSHKFDEAEMIIIGRGRRVDRGDDLGIDGSMTCKLRDTAITARQKKQRIEYLKQEVRNLFLRTPFGDVWLVNIGEVAISRIAGVGTSEFVDVTIPYSEVYDA